MPTPLLLERFQTFVTIFLGIFIEAVPFLLAGSLVSGFIEVFVSREAVLRLAPRRAALAALAGASLGMVFPVCECGVVPVTRRLYRKGMPIPLGIAFLLAAPVINPVVILSTYAAFGWGPILWGRVAFTFLIAFAVGLLFRWATPQETFAATLALQPTAEPLPPRRLALGIVAGPAVDLRAGASRALVAAGDDFLDMARYLVVGSLLAAGMQTVVPQSALLAIGAGPVTSVVAMMLLAFVLSICSTVDAFVALAFVGTFTPASILAFLVFGPMVDIKSTAMFLGVFQRRKVLYLVLLPASMVLLLGVFLNLNVGL
ncbi:MAG: permease [Anaerolineae bacterium]|nr:permease [Anaerolineae bacterium]